MTDHLYYHDSFLYEFDAEVVDIVSDPRPALVLNRTAFYPTSGGQVFDTGSITLPDSLAKVIDVTESDDGKILHFLEAAGVAQKGTRIHGAVDIARRRDHMQQHSGQHVLSAAFIKLFNLPTVSFHMGVDACSIDLDAKQLTAPQVEAAEALANDVITQDRSVTIRFVTQEEAQGLGLRKIPPVERDKLRLIDIADFDLTACGGTHVASTGQIGSILLRKTEKVRQGWRVEFVCGKRAVDTARRDFTTLTQAASVFSGHIWDVPEQARKLLEDARSSRKDAERLLEELAEFYATKLLSETPDSPHKIIVREYADRDLTFIKLLGQKLTRQAPNVVALLASGKGQPALVFAQSAKMPFDMGALMKQSLAQLGGRGGGSKDMAQGGPAQTGGLLQVLEKLASNLHA
jgi:alanyl-tRNA synthetase